MKEQSEGYMRDGQPMRYYANPLKLVLLLLGSTAFTVIGLFILRDLKAGASLYNVVIAWATVGFFGLGVVVFLIVLLRDVVLRRAILQIDELGWRFAPFARQQTVTWQNIERVAIYRNRLGRFRSMYYLVIYGRNHDKAARASRFATRFYPALHGALMTLTLNNLFVRTTPAKVERVLDRIRTRYAYELQFYGITVDTEIHTM